jgi:hypothetical protein
MLRVCCSDYHVGERLIGEKEPLEDRSETHGYCETCLKLELKDMKAALRRLHKEVAVAAEDMIGG